MAGYICLSTTLPPFCLHSSAVVALTPLPRHAFTPAHSLSGPAQMPLPLHALTPAQCTSSSPALSCSARAPTAPARMRPAAAVAITSPFRLIDPLLAHVLANEATVPGLCSLPRPCKRGRRATAETRRMRGEPAVSGSPIRHTGDDPPGQGAPKVQRFRRACSLPPGAVTRSSWAQHS